MLLKQLNQDEYIFSYLFDKEHIYAVSIQVCNIWRFSNTFFFSSDVLHQLWYKTDQYIRMEKPVSRFDCVSY